MHITILTLFPQIFKELLSTSIIKKAQEKNLVKIDLVNIRDFATDKRKSVDDRPYGGGVGMIMRVDVLYRALKAQKKGHVVLLSPKGKRYTQADAKRLARKKHLILLCGHYEGVDARIEDYVGEVVSIGDFILTGGEIAAMVVVDSVVRLIKGVLPKGAAENESFAEGLLEYPQYTRPPVFRGKKVPEVLLSGNHRAIEKWREERQKAVS